MLQNILLIWLNSNINAENSHDYRNTIDQLRCVVNNINVFNDVDQCVDFFTDVYSENVFMIISGELCQNAVPLVHDVAQLHAIFIFCSNCNNEKRYEEWAKEWTKTKGVFSQIPSILEALKKAAQQLEQNAILMSFLNANDDK
ncbi:unnamed protein product [Adineta ricciae]|uniref:Uncharacterized protein n=1 Tax=Adineta ricciae TaxID=249248 RepID=A0A815WK84_ADIRI|nr:unnamed protein product [Adineta ricciae]CAF1643396.1 unnamed protein product [Adineta ricciae]